MLITVVGNLSLFTLFTLNSIKWKLSQVKTIQKDWHLTNNGDNHIKSSMLVSSELESAVNPHVR